MKVSLSVSELQEVIKKAQKCMLKPNENKNVDVLHTVKISAINNSITMTTDTLIYSTVFKLSGNIQDPGELLLNAETLKLITKLKNTYEVIISDNLIQAGNKTLKFNSIPADQFPITKNECTMQAFTVTQTELIKALSVNYASGVEESRPIFSSVCIDSNKFVATDSHRLAWYDADITNSLETKIIIPLQATKVLANNLLDKKSNNSIVTASVDGKYRYLKLEFQNTKVITRLIEGNYINYKQVIPQTHKTIAKLNTKKLLDELSFIEDLAKKSGGSITIGMEENTLYFDAMAEGNAVTLNIESEITGELIECIGVNYKLFVDALKNAEGEEIEIKFNGAYSPMLFNNSILCPVRLKETKRRNVA